MNLRALRTLTIAVLLCASWLAPSAMASETSEDAANKKPITYTQLRNLITNFADKYMQMIGQAADTLQKKHPDPEARSGILALKLFPCSAAFSIAMDSNPHRTLLDMVVLVHLQGRVWRTSIPQRFGESAPAFMAVQRTLEDDIDEIALKVMTREKLDQLKALVDEWRRKHPDQRYVSYIRMENFEDLITSVNMPGKGGPGLSIGTLLSVFQLVNIDEASRSMDQVRTTAEKGIFLAERMPTLLRWQTQMLFYELVSSPETKQLIATSQSLRETLDRAPVIGRRLIWEAVLGMIVVALVVFFLAVLYKLISRRLR